MRFLSVLALAVAVSSTNPFDDQKLIENRYFSHPQANQPPQVASAYTPPTRQSRPVANLFAAGRTQRSNPTPPQTQDNQLPQVASGYTPPTQHTSPIASHFAVNPSTRGYPASPQSPQRLLPFSISSNVNYGRPVDQQQQTTSIFSDPFGFARRERNPTAGPGATRHRRLPPMPVAYAPKAPMPTYPPPLVSTNTQQRGIAHVATQNKKAPAVTSMDKDLLSFFDDEDGNAIYGYTPSPATRAQGQADTTLKSDPITGTKSDLKNNERTRVVETRVVKSNVLIMLTNDADESSTPGVY